MPGPTNTPTALLGSLWDENPTVVSALEALNLGPEPDNTATRLARVLATNPHLADVSAQSPLVAQRLVAVCGSGRALTEIAARNGEAASLALQWTSLPELTVDHTDIERSLRIGVACHLLAIAAMDLTRESEMPLVGAALSDLADQAVASALIEAMSGQHELRLTVIALGKWGGRELNYSSDIDLVFVHEGEASAAEAVASRLIDLLARRSNDGLVFRVDANLRPEGSAGALSRSIDSFEAYWETWAHTWEFQALLKARTAAGDGDLGEQFLKAAERFVHPKTLEADAVRDIRTMKSRSETLVTEGDELKRGVGGIRDIEFAVQLLQLVHGRGDRDLRTTNTLEALHHLGAGGYVREEDAIELATAYRWLRDLEHRIQLQDLRQTHTVPADPSARSKLARLMGYRDSPEGSATAEFESALREIRLGVRTIHERLFYRPMLEAFAASSAETRLDRQLTAFGFVDSAAARQSLAELTTGLSRRSRLMQQLLPLMLEWLSTSPDPDLGLAQLRMVMTGADTNPAVIAGLRDNPAAAERLCRVLSTAATAGRLVDRIPAVLPLLGSDEALTRYPDAAALSAEATERVRVRIGTQARTDALHRFWAEHLIETITADIAGLIDGQTVAERLSTTADALVAGLLQNAVSEVATDAPPRIAVIAMGKWGGLELNYGSDLDALIVYESSPTSDADQIVGRITEALMGSLTKSHLGLPPPPLDLDLRPEGRKGSIARSLDAFEVYWDRWGLTWEHQSLTRARFAAGDEDLGRRFVEAAATHAYPDHLSVEMLREIRAMKVRIEEERIPIGEDPDFHVKLGKGALSDIEWTVQLLQMGHGQEQPGIRTPSTLRGLAALHESRLITNDDFDALDEAYRFCTAVRNRLFLRGGRSRDSLPVDPVEAAILARSLGYEDAPRTALREEYRRLTRRSRRVMENLFYGRT